MTPVPTPLLMMAVGDASPIMYPIEVSGNPDHDNDTQGFPGEGLRAPTAV